MPAARKTLEDAQAKLSQFQCTKGNFVSDERLDDENAKLNALSSQLTTQSRVGRPARRARRQRSPPVRRLLFRVSSIDENTVGAFAAQDQFIADLLTVVPVDERKRLSGLGDKPAGG